MKKQGYTFAEMMVVMAIIALMMAIMIPRLAFQQRGAALRGAANELGSALRTARRLAITERELKALAIDIYSIPAEFMVMRWTGTTWEQEGESHALPDNIAIVSVTERQWSATPYTLNITRTDDNDLNEAEEASATVTNSITVFNPQVDALGGPATWNNLVNMVYHLVKFQPTGTSDDALIYLWNSTEGRQEIPAPTPGMALSNLVALGIPPGFQINLPNDQSAFLRLPTADSEADTYYYTIVVNPITGGVTAYDYAWGEGGGTSPNMMWDRKKDGE